MTKAQWEARQRSLQATGALRHQTAAAKTSTSMSQSVARDVAYVDKMRDDKKKRNLYIGAAVIVAAVLLA